MARRAATISLGLGAVFVVAFAATRVGQPSTGGVGWKETGTRLPAPAEELSAGVSDLQQQLAELRRQLPGAPALALASLPLPESATLCGQTFPLDRPEVSEALAYELILTAGKPLMPMLWMRRSGQWLPMIEDRLERAGLPDDLKYVAMIESDFRPTVRSPAGAVGLWQFISGTARRYGLRVDRYLDERRDPLRATDAAIDYLADLYAEFGDWYLALAAYNAGEKRIAGALEDSGNRDYFELFLPPETRRYIPRLMAAKLVTASPESYGLVQLSPVHVPRYRIVEVQVRRSRADLRKLAGEHGLDYSALRRANPQIKGSRLPRGTYRLRVPES